MATASIPSSVKAVLWSYDTDQIDVVRDKSLIIKQILDYGTYDAVQWMRRTYSHEDIVAVVHAVPRSAWGKKSLALWSLVYGVMPDHETRFA